MQGNGFNAHHRTLIDSDQTPRSVSRGAYPWRRFSRMSMPLPAKETSRSSPVTAQVHPHPIVLPNRLADPVPAHVDQPGEGLQRVPGE